MRHSCGRWFGLLLGTAALTVFSGTGKADLLSSCGTCQGATYLLQYNLDNTVTSGPSTIYDVFLTIDTSGYTGAGTNIKAVAFKSASSVDFVNSALLNAPGGTSSWDLLSGGLSANGCDGNGSGFICTQDTPPNSATVPAVGTYTWEFEYATTGTLMTGASQSSIKVEYSDGQGKKVGDLVSNGITLQACGGTSGEDCGTAPVGAQVAEPLSVLLMGTVLLGIGGLVKRKRFV